MGLKLVVFAQSVAGGPAGQRISCSLLWQRSSFPLFELLQLGDFQFSIHKCDALGGPEGIQKGGGGLLLLVVVVGW